MIVKSLLIIATAVLLGSASMTFAQTAQYDGTGDKTLSYGPKAQPAPGVSTPQGPVGADTFNPYDQTGDKTTSYGARPAR